LIAEQAVHFKNGAGRNGRGRVGDRLRDKQGRDHPAAIFGGKPVSEIQDHAGEETGLRGPEQETDDEKTGGSCHESGKPGNNAPGDHDPSDPDPRADLLQGQIAWNFEQEIAKEEDSGAPAIDIGAEGEVLVHGQRGKGNIAAVDVGDAVGQGDQRQQPP
jgi:hypothetical protein